jgi:hypothetical protein
MNLKKRPKVSSVRSVDGSVTAERTAQLLYIATDMRHECPEVASVLRAAALRIEKQLSQRLPRTWTGAIESQSKLH